jgi:lipopolysaccharide export system protein LptA
LCASFYAIVAVGFAAAFALATGSATAMAQDAAASPAASTAPQSRTSPEPAASPHKSHRESDRTSESAATPDRSSPKTKAENDSAASAEGDENSTPFGSFGGSNRGPVNIQSDSLSLDYKHATTTFIGHVHATQADGVLTTDKLIVQHGKNFNDVQKMFAEGDVRISQGLRWCTSDHAVLNQAVHTVVLTGSPVCHDGNDEIAGSKITVHLDTGKSEVEGVKALIFPRASKTRDNEASADHVK